MWRHRKLSLGRPGGTCPWFCENAQHSGLSSAGVPAACWKLCSRTRGPRSLARCVWGLTPDVGLLLLCPLMAEPLCAGLLFCKMTSGLCPQDCQPHGDPVLSPHRVALQRPAYLPGGQEGSPVLLLLSWGSVHPQTLWRTFTLSVLSPQLPQSTPRPAGARVSGRVGGSLGLLWVMDTRAGGYPLVPSAKRG